MPTLRNLSLVSHRRGVLFEQLSSTLTTQMVKVHLKSIMPSYDRRMPLPIHMADKRAVRYFTRRVGHKGAKVDQSQLAKRGSSDQKCNNSESQ